MRQTWSHSIAVPPEVNKNRNSVGAAVEVKHPKQSESQGKYSTFTSFTSTTTFSMASNSADLVNTSSCNVGTSLEYMPTCEGMLNEYLVTVLRDTGCNGVVVRKDYRKSSDLCSCGRIHNPSSCSQSESRYSMFYGKR